jgi:hypothetical protein
MARTSIAAITSIDQADPYQRLGAALIVSAINASQQGDPEAKRWLELCALRWLWLIAPQEADADSILSELLATLRNSSEVTNRPAGPGSNDTFLS